MAKTTSNVTSKKLDVVDDDDEIYYYVGVRASPFATDCAVFGLSTGEQAALRTHFPLASESSDVINGILIKG